MVASKSPRKTALKNLAGLTKNRHGAHELSIPELYPYGLLAREPRNPAYDRDVVISVTTVVEQGLEYAILTKMDRPEADDILFSGQTPLVRDFAEKVRLAYLLDLIGPITMSDLGCIRAVRNAFAHSRQYLDLDMPEFQEVLALITAADRWPGMMGGLPNQDQRERFIQTCFQLALYLFAGIHEKPEHKSQIMDQRMNLFEH